MQSYISPKTEKGLPSDIHGRGFFSKDFIKKDEVVAIKRGHVLTKEELDKLDIGGGVALKIGDDSYLSPKTQDEFEKSMIFINYSCDPNLGMKGVDTVVAFRDIESHEELTLDYAMLADDETSMKCQCHSKNCRGLVTGKDWKLPELQKKYKGYFTDYIQGKIDSFSSVGD